MGLQEMKRIDKGNIWPSGQDDFFVCIGRNNRNATMGKKYFPFNVLRRQQGSEKIGMGS
jgi:hypothetical protein